MPTAWQCEVNCENYEIEQRDFGTERVTRPLPRPGIERHINMEWAMLDYQKAHECPNL